MEGKKKKKKATHPVILDIPSFQEKYFSRKIQPNVRQFLFKTHSERTIDTGEI